MTTKYRVIEKKLTLLNDIVDINKSFHIYKEVKEKKARYPGTEIADMLDIKQQEFFQKMEDLIKRLNKKDEPPPKKPGNIPGDNQTKVKEDKQKIFDIYVLGYKETVLNWEIIQKELLPGVSDSEIKTMLKDIYERYKTSDKGLLLLESGKLVKTSVIKERILSEKNVIIGRNSITDRVFPGLTTDEVQSIVKEICSQNLNLCLLKNGSIVNLTNLDEDLSINVPTYKDTIRVAVEHEPIHGQIQEIVQNYHVTFIEQDEESLKKIVQGLIEIQRAKK